MTIKLSSKGQLVIPKALRKMAEIEEGDELDVGFSGGMIVLRKPEPLDAGRVRRLLKEGRKLPEFSNEAEVAVEAAVRRVRERASQ